MFCFTNFGKKKLSGKFLDAQRKITNVAVLRVRSENNACKI